MFYAAKNMVPKFNIFGQQDRIPFKDFSKYLLHLIARKKLIFCGRQM